MTIALLALGIAFVTLGLWSRRMNSRAAYWPQVRGVIVESELRNTIDDQVAHVAYEYAVQSTLHRSTQVSYAGMLNAALERERRVARYPVGVSVDVFYDPAAPWRAVLEHSVSGPWRTPIFIGLVLLAAAVLRHLT